MVGIFEILSGLATIILLLYYYLTRTFNYWKIRGVKGPQPIPIFGNIKDVIFQKKILATYLEELCLSYKNEPYIGIFIRNTPILILKDSALIKDVLIKDFTSFSERHTTVTKKVEPLSQHLFHLEVAKWRPLRNKLSPAFTSGKLKEMFPLIMECSHHLEQYINNMPDNNIVEVYELMGKFNTDVIGNCAFGIEMNAIADDKSEFRRMGKEIFQSSLKREIREALRTSFPKLYNHLSFLFDYSKLTTFFLNIVKETMDYRRKNKFIRHDFINILMELKEQPNKLGEEIELTDSLCAAQAYLFFGAGFESSSWTMSNILYELAQHHDIQDKLREEIKTEYERNNGTLIFESIKRMKYLHAVFQETLRKHPPVWNLFRKCTASSYTFHGTELTIPKNQTIFIPILGIHHDPSNYPNPEVFDPTRFIKEDNTINNTTYIPFGRGPRSCMGERFADYQSKVGLASFLRNYKVDVSEKTEIPYGIRQSSFLLHPTKGIYLKVSKINEK
ncbi:probable cytochrome P450 6a17 [Vespa velutina]|uniref:probable cytochrome P450 6a17 n=1 Tax=Vespa velutina TaxID=202808 RepID=UPI001FB1F4D8|nr:probable cytochrome P450 6a17 [Vespa velutina]